jgi:hypothetical protein
MDFAGIKVPDTALVRDAMDLSSTLSLFPAGETCSP